MVPEPRVADIETEVARPGASAATPQRRWPLLGMLVFATVISLILWAGIFALIRAVGSVLS